jgi:hypothetical protein
VTRTTLKAHLRAWYLIALSLIPVLWAATDWHAYTHFAGRADAASYLALLVSPALFILGARRLFAGFAPEGEAKST